MDVVAFKLMRREFVECHSSFHSSDVSEVIPSRNGNRGVVSGDDIILQVKLLTICELFITYI